MPDPVAVSTTVGSADDASRLARTLVERRLAACAQIERIDSCYRWQGAVHEEPEWRIVFKTSAARQAELAAAICQAHPYELPEIHAAALAQVHPPYAAWIDEATADAG